MRLPKEWDLPPPPKGPENIWKSYVSVRQKIPYGYFQDADDPSLMHPIPRELDLLEKAKTYLAEYPYEAVAEWLTKTSGRKISAAGLSLRVRNEQRYRKGASQARFFQKEAEKYAEKAEKLEKSLGGVQLRDIRHPTDCSCSICSRHSKPR